MYLYLFRNIFILVTAFHSGVHTSIRKIGEKEMKIQRNYTLDANVILEFEKKHGSGDRSKKVEDLIRVDLQFTDDVMNTRELEKKQLRIREELDKSKIALTLIEDNIKLAKEKEESMLNDSVQKREKYKLFVKNLDKCCIYCKGEIAEGQPKTDQFTIGDRTFIAHKNCGLDNLGRLGEVKKQYEELMLEIGVEQNEQDSTN